MDEEEAELPEIEEEVDVGEDLFAYYDDEDYPTDDKETVGDLELHPKLVHLVISVAFMMVTLTSVSLLILLYFNSL